MMLVRVLLLLLLPALAAGCTAGEVNPNLLAPKVVVDVLPSGDVAVFVHSAFGERRYDSIVVHIDNATAAERAHAFSLEERVNQSRFFLDVQVVSGESVFRFQGDFDLEGVEEKERVDVAILDPQGGWTEPRTYSLPFVQILDRPAVTA